MTARTYALVALAFVLPVLACALVVGDGQAKVQTLAIYKAPPLSVPPREPTPITVGKGVWEAWTNVSVAETPESAETKDASASSTGMSSLAASEYSETPTSASSESTAASVAPSEPSAPPDATPYTDWPDCTIYDVPAPCAMAATAAAVIHCESKGNPTAVSPTGDYGLFQLNRRWQEHRANRLGYHWHQMLEVGPNVAVAIDLWSATQSWRAWACRP